MQQPGNEWADLDAQYEDWSDLDAKYAGSAVAGPTLTQHAGAAALGVPHGLVRGVESMATGLSLPQQKLYKALGLDGDAEAWARKALGAGIDLQEIGRVAGKIATKLAEHYPEGTEDGVAAGTGQFIGQAAPQVAAAILAPESLLTRLATGATASALQTAGDEYLAAEISGATDEQKDKAWMAGLVGGGATGLAMQGILGRAFARPGASAFKQAVMSGAAGAGIGGAQTALSNVIAAHIAEYDPDRQLLENVVKSGETGALGMIALSAITRAAGARSAKRQAEVQKKAQAEQQARQQAEQARAAEEAGQANLRKVEAEDRARFERSQAEARDAAFMARRDAEAEGLASAAAEVEATNEFRARSQAEAARADAEARGLSEDAEMRRMAADEAAKLERAQYEERARAESERAAKVQAELDRQEAEFQARQAAELEQGRISREEAEVQRVAEARRMDSERARLDAESRAEFEARSQAEAARADAAQQSLKSAKRRPKRGKKTGALDIDPALEAVSNFTRRVAGRKPGTATPAIPEDHLLAQAARGLHDNLEPVTRLPNAKREEKGLRRAQSQALNKADRMFNSVVKPMLDLARKSNVKPRPDFDPNESPENRQRYIAEPTLASYLSALDAIERNPRQEKMGVEAGAGLTTDEARQILANVALGSNADAFKELATKFREITGQTRSEWRKGGLQSDEFVSFLEQEYPNYAPAKTDVEGDGPSRGGRGYSIGTHDETRRAMGRTTIPDDPFGFAIRDYINAVDRAAHNKAINRLYEAFKKNDGYGIAEVDPDSTRKYVRETKVGNKIVRGIDPSFQDEAGVVAFKDKGEPRFLKFKPEYEEFATALKKADMEDLPASLHFLKSGKAFLGKQLISHNPIATPWIAALDAIGGTIYNGWMYGAPHAIGTLRNLPGAIQALRSGDGPLAKSLHEWLAAGGNIGFQDLRTLADIQKQIDAEMKGTPNVARRYVTAMERLTRVADSQMRLAAYHEHRQRGKSISDSIEGSRNATFDWHKKGTYHGWMDGLWLFSGASVKSNAQFVSLLKATATKKSARRAMGGMLALGTAHALLNAINGGVDEQGMPLWDKLSDEQKDSGLTFMLNGEQIGPRIPLAGPLRILPGIGWRLADVMRNAQDPAVGMTPEEMIGSTLSLVIDSMNPFGQVHEDDGKATVIAHAPTLFKPVAEIWMNKVGHSGRTLYPDGYGDELTPDAFKSFAETPEWAKDLAAWISTHSGGQEPVEFRGREVQKARPGVIDWTPAAIEHVGRFLLSGALGELYSASMTDRSGPAAMPVIKKFTTEVSPYADSRIMRENVRDLEYGDAPASFSEDGFTYNLSAVAKSKQRLIDKQRELLKKQPERRDEIQKRIANIQAEFNALVARAKRKAG